MSSMKIRKATRDDVAEIVRMLADDLLGMQREKYADPLPAQYYVAFEEINADKNTYLAVVELDKKVIGTLQLTLIANLNYQGGKRALIESVHVDAAYRSQGVGKFLMEWAITRARAAGCHMVQLTSNKQRPRAIEFYKTLGFTASHEGMKLII